MMVLRELPADVAEPWPIEVTFEYSASGRLTALARVRYTDCSVHLESVRPAGVSQAHIAQWKQAVTALAPFAAYRKVCSWERAAEAPGPLAVAGLPPAPAGTESDGVLALLRRMIPFVFRRREPEQDPRDRPPRPPNLVQQRDPISAT
jgi:hypothetical protein